MRHWPRAFTIHRDAYGVPHVFGQSDESVVFGYGYAQAEDYFWQVEDVYILALGRYSEVHGPKGLNSDLLNRAFEIVPRSQRDFAALDQVSQKLYAAFAAGVNFLFGQTSRGATSAGEEIRAVACAGLLPAYGA